MNESDFISALRALADDPVARGLADDVAVFGDLVLTHDMMVAGTHWLAGADPADVAWKLVATNYSDLAAKGATPLGVLIGYQLGDDAWDARFVAGLREALAAMGGALWGGDTVAGSGSRAIGLTAIGRASHLPVPSRSGARPGDRLWVTGTIGAAYAGYRHDVEGAAATAADIAAFRRPTPRVADGIALAPHVTAMMDVSDGLLLDAHRMARASGVVIAIDSGAVPVAMSVREAGLADAAMRWGDDYALLFTLPGERAPPVAATPIGTVAAADGDAGVMLDAVPLDDKDALGYRHAGGAG